MSESTPNESVEPYEPTEGTAPAEAKEQAQPTAQANPETLGFQPLQRSAQELVKASSRQTWAGLAWWLVGAGGIAFSLTSTSFSVFYWYGGLIASLFAWYRAFRFSKQAQAAGAPKATLKQRVPLLVAAAVVIVSSVIVVPEYIHVNNPGVNTCWGTADDGSSMPVACFAPGADYKAVSLVNDPSECPAESDTYFKPDASESRYTCLVPLK